MITCNLERFFDYAIKSGYRGVDNAFSHVSELSSDIREGPHMRLVDDHRWGPQRLAYLYASEDVYRSNSTLRCNSIPAGLFDRENKMFREGFPASVLPGRYAVKAP